jgi:hypothetical protein
MLSVVPFVHGQQVDKMLERAKEVTREEPWMRVEYARFADDLVILVDGHPSTARREFRVSGL